MTLVNDIFSKIFNFPSDSGKQTEFRLEQKQFIYTCYEGVSQKRDVVIEGPTGLGKTRAILASVLPALLQDDTTRFIYSTRTITQVINIMKDQHCM